MKLSLKPGSLVKSTWQSSDNLKGDLLGAKRVEFRFSRNSFELMSVREAQLFSSFMQRKEKSTDFSKGQAALWLMEERICYIKTPLCNRPGEA